MMQMIDKIRRMIKSSSYLHLRDAEVGALSQALAVIDRFIDGKPREQLEWDDFISWENSNPGIEKLRLRIAALEGGFFSKNADERWEAYAKLVVIRNETAAAIGMQPRDFSDKKSRGTGS